MSECRRTVEQLAPYTDGLLPADARAQVERHLGACPPCRAIADAEQGGRTVVKARAGQLRETTETTLPPGLRTRCEALARAELAAVVRPSPWYNRLAAAVTIALIVLATAATIFGLATRRSDTLLARQLTLDHIKCFRLFAEAGAAGMDAAQAERLLHDRYGLTVQVPPSSAGENVALIGARRCLYAAGSIPHMMYRANGENLSLFVLDGEGRRAADVTTLGYRSRIWSEGDKTFVLVSGSAAPSNNPVERYMMQQLH
jgi:anti-sigma factor RsiW